MKPIFLCVIAVAAFAQTPQTPNPNVHYHLGPDSLAQEGVPQGEIRGPFKLPSQAYPGTQHDYWVYVPAQYDPAVPASLMIFNDGQAFMAPKADGRAQNVMDNLIYRREIPGDDRCLHQSGPYVRSSQSPRRPSGATAPPTGPPSTTRSTTAMRA